MELRGIDVSSYQGNIDWAKVAASGVQFAILRCHQKTGIDSTFKINYKGATANRIPIGVYKYCYALTAAEARKEARNVLKAIKEKTITYPVFYDLEDQTLVSLSQTKLEKIVMAFIHAIEAAGYTAGIYCGKWWYENILTEKLRKYPCWIARYPVADTGEIVEHLKPPLGMGWQYSQCGRVPGISGDVDMDIFYQDTDPGFTSGGVTAADILRIARQWIGYNDADGSHREIVDVYNLHQPRARGYRVQYSDSWCDTFVSACFIKAGDVSLIGGTECGVDCHIQLFKQAGIWIEDGTIVPHVGDIICYNWDIKAQPNDGFADHIGIVAAVIDDNEISVIEGNYGGTVGLRTIPVGWGFIRGYARPKYADRAVEEIPALKTIDTVAREVIAGKWGNGEDRKARLTAAGYDYGAVQARVNQLMA